MVSFNGYITAYKNWMYFVALSLLIVGMIVLFTPSCLFHEDYVTFAKGVSNYMHSKNANGDVNGKQLYVLILGDFYGLVQSFTNIENSMIWLSIVLCVSNLYFIYKILRQRYPTISQKQSFFLIFVYMTTTTFITLFGHPESAIASTFFILLAFYYFENSPFVSAFIILISCFVRSDNFFFFIPFIFIRYYKAIPFMLIGFSNLILNSHKTDMGFNPVSFLPTFLSVGILFIYLFRYKGIRNWDKNVLLFLMPITLYLFLVVEQSQKIYYVFIPFIILLYKDLFLKEWKTVAILCCVNLLVFGYVAHSRQQFCSSVEMAKFLKGYNIEPSDYTIFSDYYNNVTSSSSPLIFDVVSPKYAHPLSTGRLLTLVKCGMFENFKDGNFFFMPEKFCIYHK